MTNKTLINQVHETKEVDAIVVCEQLENFDHTVRKGIKDGDIDFLVFLLKKEGFWE
ncbi:MAG: hypothetical protein WC390_06450 [Sulfurimonas sp.]|jgi:predicted DNA-binding protein (UPF0278 family)